MGWAQNRYGPQPATRQSTLDEFAEPEKDAYDSATDDIPIVDASPVASPKTEESATVPMVQQTQQSMSDSSQNDAVGEAVENADTTPHEGVMATSKETGKNTQQVDMYGNPIKKAWRYY